MGGKAMPTRPEIRVNISDQRVWRDGQPVKVKNKVFALLTLFLANPGRLLTKMAILRHVWPNIHVSDASVKDCVKNLRAVLLDNASTPAFVETVRGQGYRYLGGIEVCNDHMWPGASEDAIPGILIENFSQAGGVEDVSGFSDELRDGLIDVLARRPRIKVITDPQSGIPPTYILHGRCRVLDSQCRLYLSMTVAGSGETIWSTKIDGDVTDMFGFLDQTVEIASTALRVHINALAGSVYASTPDDALTGNHEAAMINAKEGFDRKPRVRICAIAYAAAAAGNCGIVSSDRYIRMVKQHRISTADADRFPFASKSDTQLLAERLRRAGVPEEDQLPQ